MPKCLCGSLRLDTVPGEADTAELLSLADEAEDKLITY